MFPPSSRLLVSKISHLSRKPQIPPDLLVHFPVANPDVKSFQMQDWRLSQAWVIVLCSFHVGIQVRIMQKLENLRIQLEDKNCSHLLAYSIRTTSLTKDYYKSTKYFVSTTLILNKWKTTD